MSAPSIPHTFSTGQVIASTDVNANFTALAGWGAYAVMRDDTAQQMLSGPLAGDLRPRNAGATHHPLAYPEYSITGDGSTVDSTGLNLLVNRVSALGGGTILIDRPYKVSSSFSTLAGVHLRVVEGGTLKGSGTDAVTLRGEMLAGEYQVFDGVVVSFAAGAQTVGVKPHWWGCGQNARFADDTVTAGGAYTRAWYQDAAKTIPATDDTAILPAVLTAADGRPVWMFTGHHKVTSQVTIASGTRLWSPNKSGFVAATLMPDAVTDENAGMIFADGKSDIEFNGVGFYGLAAHLPAQGAYPYAGLLRQEVTVCLHRCSGVRFLNCDLGWTTKAVLLDSCDDILFDSGTVFHDIVTREDGAEGYGCLCVSHDSIECSNIRWIGTRFVRSQRHHIYLSGGSANILMVGCDFDVSWSIAVSLNSTPSELPLRNVQVVGCNFRGFRVHELPDTSSSVSAWGIGGTGNMDGVHVAYCNFEDGDDAMHFQGNYTYDPSKNPRNLTVAYNTVANCTESIYFDMVNGGEIVHNTVRDTTTGPIVTITAPGLGSGSVTSGVLVEHNSLNVTGHSLTFSGNSAGGCSRLQLGHNSFYGTPASKWNVPTDTVPAIAYAGSADVRPYRFYVQPATGTLGETQMQATSVLAQLAPADGRDVYVVGAMVGSDTSIGAGSITCMLGKSDGSYPSRAATLNSSSATILPLYVEPGGFLWEAAKFLRAYYKTDSLTGTHKVEMTIYAAHALE